MKSSCSQQLQSTQVSIEYIRIPVFCSLTSRSARATPKGESFCKGIPHGAAREGAFVADCVPRQSVARKVRLRFWLVRHSNVRFAAQLDLKRFVAAVSRTSFVRAEVLQSCYHGPRAYCCRRSRSPTVWRISGSWSYLARSTHHMTSVCATSLRMLTRAKKPLTSASVTQAHSFFLQAILTAMTWHNLADSVSGITARANLWRATGRILNSKHAVNQSYWKLSLSPGAYAGWRRFW